MERVLGPIEKEEGGVVMVQEMVEPGRWLAAAVAAHSSFLLFFLNEFRLVLLVLVANLHAAVAAAGKLEADLRRV